MRSVWLVIAVAAACVALAGGLPVLSHPLETEVMPEGLARATALPLANPPPMRCFAIHRDRRIQSRDCLVAFLQAAEQRLTAALPTVQGNASALALAHSNAELIHDVLHHLAASVAAQPSDVLERAYVEETLFAADIVSEQGQAMSVMFEDFVERGGEAVDVVDQLQYDPGSSSASGLSVFASGLIAPPAINAISGAAADADALRKYGNFQDIANPNGCSEEDRHTKPECMDKFPIKDDRFEQFERWERPVSRSYIHQPLEEALHERHMQEQQREQQQQQLKQKQQEETHSQSQPSNRAVLLSVTAYKLH